MKLLVTGGAGFIGSHFVRERFQRHPDDEIVVLDNLTYAGHLDNLAEVKDRPGYRFVRADVCDQRAVQDAMEGCEVVIHLAAESHVDRSITNAAPFLTTNVQGTFTLLEAARTHKLKTFVHTSTDEVYGPILEGAYAEDAPLRPRSPYAASKAAADLLVQAYQETYGVSAMVVRPTNVFGPRQLPEKFIPLCLTNALVGEPLPLYGDGLQRRSWLFVSDLCRALDDVVAHGEAGAIYNVPSPWELPNREVARLILHLLNQPEALIQHVPDRPGHDRRYAMEGAPLARLGWHPSVAFEDGLRQTIAWYQEHPEWWQPRKARLREDPYHWLNRPVGARARQATGALA